MKFVFGKEEYLIDNEIKTFISTNQDVVVFDQDNSLEELILEITTISMFSNKRNIVAKNISAFVNDSEAHVLINHLKNLEEHVEIIFAFENEISHKNILANFLKENYPFEEFKEIDAKKIIDVIKNIVKEKKGIITTGAALKLSTKLPIDLRIIIQEVDKLLLQKNEIDESMVEESVGDYIKNDYYSLSNAIIDLNPTNIFTSYDNKILSGDEPGVIIGQISSILSLALLVGQYRSKGFSNTDISEILKIHIFRIKKSSELLEKTSLDKIQSLTKKLAQLDFNIKSGKEDSQLALKTFLLKLVR